MQLWIWFLLSTPYENSWVTAIVFLGVFGLLAHAFLCSADELNEIWLSGNWNSISEDFKRVACPPLAPQKMTTLREERHNQNINASESQKSTLPNIRTSTSCALMCAPDVWVPFTSCQITLRRKLFWLKTFGIKWQTIKYLIRPNNLWDFRQTGANYFAFFFILKLF